MVNTISILPSRYNISVVQGDTVRVCFAFTDENGDAIDMSEVDAVFNLYLRDNSEFDFTTGDAIDENGQLSWAEVVDNNRLDLHILADATSGLLPCKYIYTVALIYDNGDVRTAITGDFIVAKMGSYVTSGTTDINVTLYNQCGGAIDALSALPEYLNDEDAVLGGLVAGDWYIVAYGSDIAAPGTLKKIL